MGLLFRSPIVSITLAPLCVGYRIRDKPPAFRRGYLTTQLQFNGVRATPTPVPEASTVASLGGMLLLGGAGLALRARKRARA